MNFVISGYYGFDNSGDDALLLSIINGIKEKYFDANITVLSRKPEKTNKTYSLVNVNAINRYNIFSLISSIKKCDVLISGGGTLIQDATSTKSLLYYLGVIKLAQIFRKKVMVYANGIGPLTSFKNIEITKKILNNVDVITLRDEKSYEELKHIGVTEPKIELTADPAFLLKQNENGAKILETYSVPSDKKLMCVSVREWKNSPKNFTDIMAEFCDLVYEKFDIYTILLPMQESRDFAISSEIKEKMKNKSTIIAQKYPVQSVLSIINEMYICVGMRLHTLIYSASCLVPTIGIAYDPKVSGFMEYINEDRFIDVENITSEALFDLLQGLIDEYEAVKSHMKFNTKELQIKAEKNLEILSSLVLGEKE